MVIIIVYLIVPFMEYYLFERKKNSIYFRHHSGRILPP